MPFRTKDSLTLGLIISLSTMTLFGCGGGESPETPSIPELPTVPGADQLANPFEMPDVPTVENPDSTVDGSAITVENPDQQVPVPGDSNGYIGPVPDCFAYTFTSSSLDNPIAAVVDATYTINPQVPSFLDFSGVTTDLLSAAESGADLAVTVAEGGTLTLVNFAGGSIPDSVLIEGNTFPAQLFFDTLLAGEDPSSLLTAMVWVENDITDEAIQNNNDSATEIEFLLSPAEEAGQEIPPEVELALEGATSATAVESPIGDIPLDSVATAFEEMVCSVELTLPEGVELPTLISSETVDVVDTTLQELAAAAEAEEGEVSEGGDGSETGESAPATAE